MSASLTADTIISAASWINTSYYLLQSTANLVIPTGFRTYVSSLVRRHTKRFSSQLTIVIQEFEGLGYNFRFDAADTYLGTKFSPLTRRIKVYQQVKEVERDIITVDNNEEILDSFDGVLFTWVLNSTSVTPTTEEIRRGTAKREERFFELRFDKKYKDLVLNAYLPHITKISNQIKEAFKVLRLYSYDDYSSNLWRPVALTHPASFETIAMEPEAKAELIEDLDMFMSRKDYYKRVGKAWKRGYLLYGPPGTGKSSLIAAMADYLKFDIYDLDLKAVRRNTDLRSLLLRSSNKSILVVEDIDCCGINVGNRKSGNNDDYDDDSDDSDDDGYHDSKITMSGLLNFIDGLWSSCGEERVIVFTTNHKEKLDPALLRPGRMDVHIEMSYCKFGSFKTLGRNYLKVEDHKLFGEIESLLSEVEVSPAEVGGQLMKSKDSDTALEILVKYLNSKKQKKNPKSQPRKSNQASQIQEDKNLGQKPPYHRNKKMRRRRNRY